ncbi:Crp/Fnr family transcriptional regulator [Actinocrinis puniceicyclus]|uniref:Crp/Fnr family transcriptional regulator n=1 Tax=Actinocrinis puniceicyclus TaxID=977794 RepID=A0A8J7WT88_9ACTN|nr:Crp/Fnr family transcriptional regulator [Actinocrinis puniceicyclus]MBS2964774.1 Crp/Fnr family transcriptional regulator [Actinocrinis puniceicyclus]
MSEAFRWREQPFCSAEELAEMESIGHPLNRAAEQPFFLEGEPGDFALLIKKGFVKVVQGEPGRIVDVRGPGAIVGEIGVITEEPRSAGIIALNDVSAVFLPKGPWTKFLLAHPHIILDLWAATAIRTRRANTKRTESELAIGQQLAKALIELVDYGVGERLDEDSALLRMSQEEMSALVGANKLESVKKVIRLLKASGIVDTGRQAITIRKLSALRNIADGLMTVG